MRKLLTLTAAAALVAAFGFAAGPASAQKQTCSGGGCDQSIVKGSVKGQSDHALFSSAAGDTAIYCGVELDLFVEPWTLHVAASAPSSNGKVKITFNDGDSIEFAVASGSSFSTVQALGGVPGVTGGVAGTPPGVDDLVKVSGSGGVTLMMVSAEVHIKATDPFDEAADTVNSSAAEPDNFCITAPDDPGATIPSGNPFAG